MHFKHALKVHENICLYLKREKGKACSLTRLEKYLNIEYILNIFSYQFQKMCSTETTEVIVHRRNLKGTFQTQIKNIIF